MYKRQVVEYHNERTRSAEARIVVVRLVQIFHAMRRSVREEGCENGGVEVLGCP